MELWIYASNKQFSMNQGKYFLAQLTVFSPREFFDRIVREYNGNKINNL